MAIRNAGHIENPVRTPSRNGLLVRLRNLDVWQPPQLFLILITDRRRKTEKSR